MARINAKAHDHRRDSEVRTAAGFGVEAAIQKPEALLRRVVMANLLWEDVAYQSGSAVAAEMARLVAMVAPEVVADMAIEAREDQKLRHVPLFLLCVCAELPSHRHVVAKTIPRVVQRADELTEFLALYWRDGRRPLAAGIKRGLAAAFQRFSAYQLGKYDRGTAVKLRDVMFLVHPRPRDEQQAEMWRTFVAGKLPVPDTWEVALSRGEDKRATWERLIREEKLGALAFLRNLRNMEQVSVDPAVIRAGFEGLRTERLLPLNFLAAAKAAPRWVAEVEAAMIGSLGQYPKLQGETVLIVDVSGSMRTAVSDKSDFARLDAAAAMAVMAREVCEHVTLWATAGSDYTRVHQTEELPAYRGFALVDEVRRAAGRLGGGGIFTRQCLDAIRTRLGSRTTDRIIVFSDSQDCDLPASGLPRPFSPRNYIVDVSAHARGIAYDGVWTAEVSGWSERFLAWVQALEGQQAA